MSTFTLRRFLVPPRATFQIGTFMAAGPHSRGIIARVCAGKPGISVVPANEASCDDLRAIFGTRGQGSRCWCQRYKLAPRESFRAFPAEERAHRLRTQTECGHPGSDTTSGLVAYLESEPVGW